MLFPKDYYLMQNSLGKFFHSKTYPRIVSEFLDDFCFFTLLHNWLGKNNYLAIGCFQISNLVQVGQKVYASKNYYFKTFLLENLLFISISYCYLDGFYTIYKRIKIFFAFKFVIFVFGQIAFRVFSCLRKWFRRNSFQGISILANGIQGIEDGQLIGSRVMGQLYYYIHN